VNVAVIPARGGSKRIPRKNIRPFAGKPIIAYSIAAARDSGLFARIIVSTEDPEIAAAAREHGAETPFVRPAELCDDHTGTNEVTAHALSWLEERGEVCAFACCIYATAPFLRGEDLRRGYDALATGNKQFAFSATSFAFPIQRAIRIADGVRPFFPEWIESNSQDLEPAYHDAGQFYWRSPQVFLSGVTIFAPHSAAVLLPRHRVQDIDTEEDWRRAELMYASLGGGRD